MDEVPVIIHRLSLRLWVPEHREREDEELAKGTQDTATEEKPVDPLASPPQDPVDGSGNILDASQIASLSLDTGSEMHALFSQKNLLRLRALTDSHKTLSLFTPSIRDVVFRAWAGPTERGELHGSSDRATPVRPAIPRSHSYASSTSTTYVFSENADFSHNSARPTISSFGSAASGLGLGSSKHGKARKRKHRVVNLRKKANHGDEVESVSAESATASGTTSSAPSVIGERPRTPECRDGELVTPPSTPNKSPVLKEPGDGTPLRMRDLTPRPPQAHTFTHNTPKHQHRSPSMENSKASESSIQEQRGPSQSLRPPRYSSEKTVKLADSASKDIPLRQLSPSQYIEPAKERMEQQAWMTKMASEIVRRVRDQKAGDSGFWDRNDGDELVPPPAYGA